MSALSDAEPVEAVLQRAHSLLEGPRIGANGELVYSDVIVGGVFSCSADGTVTELLAGRRGIGGILPHADGGWVLSGRTVIHLSPDGSQRELLSDPGAPGYNDLFSTHDGDLLAGELRYRPMSGEEPVEGRVVSLSHGAAPRTLAEPVRWSNGIGLSPDGATLYVSDYARQEVLACPAAGGEPRRFAASPLRRAAPPTGSRSTSRAACGWRSARAEASRASRRRASWPRSSMCRRASCRASASAARTAATF